MEIPEGVNRWMTKQGITVLRVHYSADPDKRSAVWAAELKQSRGGEKSM